MRYLLVFFLVAARCLSLPAQQVNPGSNFDPTVYPDRVMLTIPGDPATSCAVSWRTVYENTVSAGEIIEAFPSPRPEKQARMVQGTSAAWEKGSSAAMGHKVVFDDLKPGTLYAYRVGDGTNWSEWFQFKTASDKAGPFSFLYFGDVQDQIKSDCSRVLRQAYTHFPSAGFMLFAGDLVSRSNENYWREFFYAGDWIFGTKASVPTPGNHEYDKLEDGSRTFSKHWQQIFTMPGNGPDEKFAERVYYFDYQGARFISFDSPAMGTDPADAEMILNWLDQTLLENPNPWTIVFTHYPVYSCSQGRDNEEYRQAVKPILEKYGVDLVLTGHDHTYCRGQNPKEAGGGGKNKPMYVVSVAGPKMYGLATSFWSDRMASNTQLYQHITVSGNSLNYQSYTINGQLYDEFEITKNNKGENRVSVPGKIGLIKQRTEIPENAKDRYTEEDLQKYQKKFGEK
ncbi:MAG: metallophosphoesterase [Mangrovibacterium sp.]